MTCDDLEHSVAVLLGGRTAERLVFRRRIAPIRRNAVT